MQVHIALGKLLQDVSDKTIEHNNWFYEYKIDGLRTLIFSDGNIVSRYGNTLYIDVNKDIIKQIPRGYVLDCESFANNVWQTMSIKSKTKSKHIQNNIKIYVFDIVDQDTILKGKVYEVPYEQRKQELQKLLKYISTKDKRFIYVPHIRLQKIVENILWKLLNNITIEVLKELCLRKLDTFMFQAEHLIGSKLNYLQI